MLIKGIPKPMQSRSHQDSVRSKPNDAAMSTFPAQINPSGLGLTASEAARHLGVSLSTIRRWSDMGYLKGYRTPGGQRRFSVQQLDEFLATLEWTRKSSDELPL